MSVSSGRSVVPPASPVLRHFVVLNALTLALNQFETEFLVAAMHAEHERSPGSWLETALFDYLTAYRGVA